MAVRCGLVATALVMSMSWANATSFTLAPDQKLVGAVEVYVTRDEDTLLDVARANDLGYGQLVVINQGIDPWLPGPGRRVTLPSVYLVPEGRRTGIVIDLAEQRLYYFSPDGHSVETYPIGVGVQGRSTPLGVTKVVGKDVRPTWYPPPSIRNEKPELPKMVPPGPDNPLGEYALRLGWSKYFIHGTNKPYGVGRNVSHGCIRLYPEDMERLFHEVAVGTPVRTIDQEIRLAWIDGELYLAVTPSKQQMDELAVNQRMSPAIPADLVRRVVEAAGNQVDRVDWGIVERIGLQRSGQPLPITKPSSSGKPRRNRGRRNLRGSSPGRRHHHLSIARPSKPLDRKNDSSRTGWLASLSMFGLISPPRLRESPRLVVSSHYLVLGVRVAWRCGATCIPGEFLGSVTCSRSHRRHGPHARRRCRRAPLDRLT